MLFRVKHLVAKNPVQSQKNNVRQTLIERCVNVIFLTLNMFWLTRKIHKSHEMHLVTSYSDYYMGLYIPICIIWYCITIWYCIICICYPYTWVSSYFADFGQV